MYDYFFYIVLASVCIALANLCIRKSIEACASSADPFLITRFISSGIFVALYALCTTGIVFDFTNLILGAFGGCFLGILLFVMGKTLAYGPASLSLAIINGASIIPPLMMALLFGSFYGHTYTIYNGLGSTLVIIGLVWAGWKQINVSKQWLFFVIITTTIHALFLTFFQWRALLLNPTFERCYTLPFYCNPAGATLFTISMFCSAAAIQLIIAQKRITSCKPSAYYLFGIGGGFINGLGSLTTVRATEVAHAPWEKAILFPLYAVILIILCNCWAKILYKDTINWLAMITALIGIFIATQ